VAEDSDFDAFYAASYPRVVRQVYALTNDYGEAQDITQDAFTRAWRRWPLLHAYDRPEAWVRTVACREAISRWRKARTLATALLRHGAPPPVPGPGPDHVALISALARVPPQQRLALVLHYVGDLSVDEIAHELGCPPGSVKSRLSRGREALAALLGDSSDDVPLNSTTSTVRDCLRPGVRRTESD
jgi:RNA polymerase sigma-70 factor, ECF subfamily